jgi:preprotein translocase subunit SecG
MGLLIGTYLSILAIFLILLVLVQRGRGGGLTGALGGMGGSSAFGAKAGDIFTRITIVVAGIWIASCALAGFWANTSSDRLGGLGESSAPLMPGMSPATETPSSDAPPADSTTTPSTATPAPAESTAPSPPTGGEAATNAPAESTAPATESAAP